MNPTCGKNRRALPGLPGVNPQGGQRPPASSRAVSPGAAEMMASTRGWERGRSSASPRRGDALAILSAP